MRRGLIATVGVAAMLASVAACGSDGGDDNANKDPKERTDTLTVWLMQDAQTSWPELVKEATATFNKKYPKVKVKIQYQQWGDKVNKLDTALGGKSAPDVVEMGNTETLKYIVGGAFEPIDPSKYDNSDTWIKGLKDTCSMDGKLYCVPYLAGARVGIYRTDMLKEVGFDKAPADNAELTDALDKLQAKYGADDKKFSALYMPGRYWYSAMSYVYDAGGSIAEDDGGEWKGNLSSAESKKGLETWADLVEKYYHGDKTKDEQGQGQVMAQDKAAVLYANGWEAGGVSDPKQGGKANLKDKVATFGFPGPNGPLPSFIGGSDLAIPVKSDAKDLSEAWIAAFTDEKIQEGLVAKSVLPNNEKQLAPLKEKPETAAAANAVGNAWFTPIAEGWASIEQGNVLQNMLVEIVTGKASIDEATAAADKKIDAQING